MTNAINYENAIKKLKKTEGYKLYENMILKSRLEAAYFAQRRKECFVFDEPYVDRLAVDADVSIYEGTVESIKKILKEQLDRLNLSQKALSLLENTNADKYTPAQVYKFVKFINNEIGKGAPQPE